MMPALKKYEFQWDTRGAVIPSEESCDSDNTFMPLDNHWSITKDIGLTLDDLLHPDVHQPASIKSLVTGWRKQYDVVNSSRYRTLDLTKDQFVECLVNRNHKQMLTGQTRKMIINHESTLELELGGRKALLAAKKITANPMTSMSIVDFATPYGFRVCKLTIINIDDYRELNPPGDPIILSDNYLVMVETVQETLCPDNDIPTPQEMFDDESVCPAVRHLIDTEHYCSEYEMRVSELYGFLVATAAQRQTVWNIEHSMPISGYTYMLNDGIVDHLLSVMPIGISKGTIKVNYFGATDTTSFISI